MTKARKKLPNKTGKPAHCRTELIRLLDEYTGGPGTVQELCRYLGITAYTFYEVQRTTPEFQQAVMRVRDRADDKVEASLYDRAIGYSYTEISRKTGVGKEGQRIDEETVHDKELAPDVGAQMNWLKNRRPDKWREKVDVEVSGGAGWGAQLSKMRQLIGEPDAD